MKLLYLDLYPKNANDQFEVTLTAERIGLVDILSRYVQVQGQVNYTFTWVWKNSNAPTMKDLEIIITHSKEPNTNMFESTIVSIIRSYF